MSQSSSWDEELNTLQQPLAGQLIRAKLLYAGASNVMSLKAFAVRQLMMKRPDRAIPGNVFPTINLLASMAMAMGYLVSWGVLNDATERDSEFPLISSSSSRLACFTSVFSRWPAALVAPKANHQKQAKTQYRTIPNSERYSTRWKPLSMTPNDHPYISTLNSRWFETWSVE